MNLRNALIASLALNLMLIFLVFMVKGNATDQAKEYVRKTVEPMQEQVRQARDIYENNKVLWSMVTEIQNSSDKSRAAVRRLADANKRVWCKGKQCEGDDARLTVGISNVPGQKYAKVGWGLYSFTVLYDDKEKFVGINLDDLLDKAHGSEQVEEAEVDAE